MAIVFYIIAIYIMQYDAYLCTMHDQAPFKYFKSAGTVLI